MIKYKNKYFEGERILYGINDALLKAGSWCGVLQYKVSIADILAVVYLKQLIIALYLAQNFI